MGNYLITVEHDTPSSLIYSAATALLDPTRISIEGAAWNAWL